MNVGQIGDTVFCDLNANGIQEPGDLGIPGVTIILICKTTNGTPLGFGTAVTDAQGKYLFYDVPAGVCEVWANYATVPRECHIVVCPPMVTVNLESVGAPTTGTRPFAP